MHQVHGGEVLDVHVGGGPLQVVGTADAVVTTMPGVVLAVRVADCVPVLLAAPGVVAAVHSGWRSTSVDVVGAAVQRMVAAGADPVDITAWVGPHISRTPTRWASRWCEVSRRRVSRGRLRQAPWRQVARRSRSAVARSWRVWA